MAMWQRGNVWYHDDESTNQQKHDAPATDAPRNLGNQKSTLAWDIGYLGKLVHGDLRGSRCGTQNA